MGGEVEALTRRVEEPVDEVEPDLSVRILLFEPAVSAMFTDWCYSTFTCEFIDV